jgi:hypothetical protein
VDDGVDVEEENEEFGSRCSAASRDKAIAAAMASPARSGHSSRTTAWGRCWWMSACTSRAAPDPSTCEAPTRCTTAPPPPPPPAPPFLPPPPRSNRTTRVAAESIGLSHTLGCPPIASSFAAALLTANLVLTAMDVRRRLAMPRHFGRGATTREAAVATAMALCGWVWAGRRSTWRPRKLVRHAPRANTCLRG